MIYPELSSVIRTKTSPEMPPENDENIFLVILSGIRLNNLLIVSQDMLKGIALKF